MTKSLAVSCLNTNLYVNTVKRNTLSSYSDWKLSNFLLNRIQPTSSSQFPDNSFAVQNIISTYTDTEQIVSMTLVVQASHTKPALAPANKIDPTHIGAQLTVSHF